MFQDQSASPMGRSKKVTYCAYSPYLKNRIVDMREKQAAEKLSATPMPAATFWTAKQIRYWLGSISIAASVITGIVVSGFLLSKPGEVHSAVLVDEIASDFETSENRGRIYDKAELESSTSVSWVAKQVGIGLPTAINVPSGYQPAGAELCTLLEKKIPCLQYITNQSDALSLYVMEGKQTNSPEGGRRLTGQTHDGLTVVAWNEGGLWLRLDFPTSSGTIQRTGWTFTARNHQKLVTSR